MSNTPMIIQSTNDEANYVRKKLIEFNSKHVPNGIYEEINLCFKDDKEKIIAGLNIAICWNWMEIDILWVGDDHRGQGLGKKLLQEAEQIARAKNCTFIKLNTLIFQAPDFYKKFGYYVMTIIENAPLGCKHYYYRKDIQV
jgi:ribosomal protein S18 acetylase RimI-like enzyme